MSKNWTINGRSPELFLFILTSGSSPAGSPSKATVGDENAAQSCRRMTAGCLKQIIKLNPKTARSQ